MGRLDHKKHPARLTDDERRTELRVLIQSAQATTRTRLLLMADEQGESPNDAGIARALEITVHTVEITCQRYLQYGLQAVLERALRKDKGVLQKVDGRVEAQLITLARSGTAANAALEAQRKAVPTNPCRSSASLKLFPRVTCSTMFPTCSWGSFTFQRAMPFSSLNS